MAPLAHRTDQAAWIDRSLDYLIGEWSAIPEVASEWEAWDELDRLDFVLEWPLREIRLHEIQRWDAEGSLTPAQRERFAELDRLIQRHRSTVDRLLAE